MQVEQGRTSHVCRLANRYQRGDLNIGQHTGKRQNSDSPEARGCESARGKLMISVAGRFLW